MADYQYKKIITRKKADDMRIWELIFFMFWDDYMESTAKGTDPITYKTEDEIIEALKKHYVFTNKDRLAKLSQSSISKGMGKLRNPVVYQSKTYVIKKTAKHNR